MALGTAGSRVGTSGEEVSWEGTKDAFPCHSWVAETGHRVEAEVSEETEPFKFPRKLLSV